MRNNDPIARGDLIVVDIGAEVEGYAADVTRTFPADGSFTPEQKVVYEAVLAAQEESSRVIKPNATLLDAQQLSQQAVRPRRSPDPRCAHAEEARLYRPGETAAGNHVEASARFLQVSRRRPAP